MGSCWDEVKSQLWFDPINLARSHMGNGGEKNNVESRSGISGALRLWFPSPGSAMDGGIERQNNRSEYFIFFVLNIWQSPICVELELEGLWWGMGGCLNQSFNVSRFCSYTQNWPARMPKVSSTRDLFSKNSNPFTRDAAQHRLVIQQGLWTCTPNRSTHPAMWTQALLTRQMPRCNSQVNSVCSTLLGLRSLGSTPNANRLQRLLLDSLLCSDIKVKYNAVWWKSPPSSLPKVRADKMRPWAR